MSSLPSNSVGNAQLRDRAVTEKELAGSAVITRKLANGAVTTRKIARGSITGSRLAPDTLGGGQIDESQLGSVPLADLAERAKLATRAEVADRVERVERALRADTADLATLAEEANRASRADRAATADGLTAVDVNGTDVALSEGAATLVVVDCDAGFLPTGGGYLQTDDFGDLTILGSSGPDGPAWQVIVLDGFPDTAQPAPGTAYAVCVRADDQT